MSLLLESLVKHAELTQNFFYFFIIRDEMISSRANVIIWDEMLSSGANIMIWDCSARDWERSGLLEENPQSGCSDICASLKGPL